LRIGLRETAQGSIADEEEHAEIGYQQKQGFTAEDLMR